MSIAAIVVAAEVLGTLGLYRRIAMCVTIAAIGLVGCHFGAARSPRREARRAISVAMSARLVAVGVIALVTAAWIVRTVAALRHGMETVDTLWYHMPMAARFVQSGSTTSLHYVDADPVTVFYPATSPLLHGFGLQLFSNDFLSPLLNLGWLAVALTASWSIGAPFGVAPTTMTGGAIVLATPGFVSTQPGGAYTDVVGLALFLSAIALLVHGRRVEDAARARVTLVAALAAGLALGTKFTFIAPVGALTLVVLYDVMRKRAEVRRRMLGALAWCAPLAVAGSYFYARNAARVGNPLPQTAFGPLHLPTPPVLPPTFSVSQYLFDGYIWRKFYVPGLWAALGPAWWAVLGLSIIGAVVVVITARDPFMRLLGAVVVVTVVAYLLTPQFLGFVHRPVYFVFNVRYLSPAFALALCTIPTVPPLVRAHLARIVLAAYVAVLLATQFGPTVWAWSAIGISRSQFHERIGTFDVTIGAVFGVLVAVLGSLVALYGMRTRAMTRPILISSLCVLGIAILLAGYPLQESYLHRRYLASGPLPTIYRWAQSEHHERIGVVGIDLQYPLYGRDGSNYVQYIGKRLEHGGFTPYTTCQGWRRAVDAARFGYVVIAPRGFGLIDRAPEARELKWTTSAPGTHIVYRDGPAGAATALVRLDGPLDPNRC